MQFPDLADLDRPRSAAEWDAALKRFRAEVKRIDPMLHFTEGLATPTLPRRPDGRHTPPVPKPVDPPPTDPNEPAAKSPDLAAAQKFVAETVRQVCRRSGRNATGRRCFSFTSPATYADRRDDLFKFTYLPFPQAHPRGRNKAAARILQAARAYRLARCSCRPSPR